MPASRPGGPEAYTRKTVFFFTARLPPASDLGGELGTGRR